MTLTNTLSASVELEIGCAQHLTKDIVPILEDIARKYPQDFVEGQLRDVPRIAFHIRAAIDAAPKKPIRDLSLCDIGGGIGLFSMGCAAIGFQNVTLIDDFRDCINLTTGADVLELHRSYGVNVCCRDVVEEGMDGLSECFDVVTSFDSMEHWHRSPKTLFRHIIHRLPDGGGLLLGVPNCVNLRKRLTVPFGYGKWSSMSDWYDQDQFRGHVREPDVGDLKYIAQDLGLCEVKIFGRNWLGSNSSTPAIRFVSRVIDMPLRIVPSLCSDIYVSGKKPHPK